MIRPTRVLLQQRQPMIKFLGRRHTPPGAVDHSPQVHPASPKDSLPSSFATYRQQAIQHGPLGGRSPAGSRASPPSPGHIGTQSGHSLGSIAPAQGQFFDRSELPKRFQRTDWSPEEMEAIESGGASMWA